MRFTTTNRSSTLAMLAALPKFADYHRSDLSRVDRAGTQVDIDAGRVLCRQGDIGAECFIVLSGHAHVTIDDRRVATVGRGAFIGEIALLSPAGRRIATVIAQSPMSLFVFGPREFRDLVRTNPGLSKRLLYDISERLTDDLAEARIDDRGSSRIFAGGRHWGDDRRSISLSMGTLRDSGRPLH